MTLIYGQVESLKKVKSILESKNINRFKSIREINQFISNYENELRAIDSKVEAGFLEEVKELKKDATKYEEYYNSRKIDRENELKKKLLKLQSKVVESSGVRLLNWILKFKIQRLERNFDKRIEKQLATEKEKLNRKQEKVRRLEIDRDQIIEQRCFSARSELKRIKSTVDELAPSIAGAIGESLVNKELQKLSDEYILINDFSRSFDPPIYNRKQGDKIFSIQIDHILISRAGVFILETKNWSKKSLENLSLRSPIEQIKRVNFALFVLLNGNKRSTERIGLKSHHWGDRNIPIRNLIVMIHNKPKERFKHVQIKRLDELIGYVKYFELIMSKEEVNKVYEYLR